MQGNAASEARRAQATLVALYGSVGMTASLSGGAVTLLPELAPRRATEAIEALIALPKPVLCVGVRVLERLYIAAWGGRPSTHGNALRQMVHEMFCDDRPGTSSGCDVLVMAQSGDTITLSCAECEQWLTEYSLPVADLSIAPSQEGANAPAAFLALVRPPSGGSIRTL